MRKLYLLVFIVFFSSYPQANAIEQAEIDSATNVIENLHTALLESMQAGKNWTYAKRYEFLSPVIKSSFDFDKMGRLVLSRHWKKLSENERKHFLELMPRLTTATYASRFTQFDNEKFTLLDTENIKKQRILVKTEIASADKIHEMNYVLHKPNENWLIISIMANGINELAIKRGEYSSILKEDSFGALLQQIEEQISRLKAQ